MEELRSPHSALDEDPDVRRRDHNELGSLSKEEKKKQIKQAFCSQAIKGVKESET